MGRHTWRGHCHGGGIGVSERRLLGGAHGGHGEMCPRGAIIEELTPGLEPSRREGAQRVGRNREEGGVGAGDVR